MHSRLQMYPLHFGLADVIKQAYERGFLEGYPNSQFRP